MSAAAWDRDLVDLAATREMSFMAAGRDRAAITVDLGARFPIRRVTLEGNLEGILATAAGEAGPVPTLAFSSDGRDWSEPEAAPRDAGLAVAPGSGAWTRHVRIDLPAGASSQGARLGVWCGRDDFDLLVLRRLLGVDFNIVHERPGAVLHTSYSLVSGENPRSRALVGVALLENGAFGNCLVQYYVAITVARALGVSLIKIPMVDRSQAIFLSEPLTIGGITFIPADAPLPDDGLFLCGMFFDAPFQRLVDARGSLSMREVVHTYIRRVFDGLPPVFEAKPEDQLIVHIRSGDIFSTWIDPNYPQPPLAFYRMVIERLLAEGRIRSVKMVFENRANPVIPALEAYVAGLGLPLTTQSGTLAQDVAAIANGRYLVFGFGSFGPGVCHLSERVDQVFYFSCNWPQGFQGIETVGRAIEVRDVGGGYMKIGEWTNSEAQRRLMIDYPADKLAFDDRL